MGKLEPLALLLSIRKKAMGYNFFNFYNFLTRESSVDK